MSSSHQADINDSIGMISTRTQAKQKRSRKYIVIGSTAIVVVLVVVIIFVVKRNNKSSSNASFPSESEIPSGCFQNSTELRSNVIAYINGETSVYSQYGTSIGDWCVDYIEDFSELFYDRANYTFFDTFNEDISKWNTSAATDMSYMFYHANNFNQDLSSWDVSSVRNMRYMFADATNFNQDLSLWNVSSVDDMSYLFFNASAFNQNLCQWINHLVAYEHDTTDTFNYTNCPNTTAPIIAEEPNTGPFCYSC